MPAVVKSTLGSFAGTSDAEGIITWSFFRKNSQYFLMSSFRVIIGLSRIGGFKRFVLVLLEAFYLAFYFFNFKFKVVSLLYGYLCYLVIVFCFFLHARQ